MKKLVLMVSVVAAVSGHQGFASSEIIKSVPEDRLFNDENNRQGLNCFSRNENPPSCDQKVEGCIQGALLFLNNSDYCLDVRSLRDDQADFDLNKNGNGELEEILDSNVINGGTQ